MAERLDALTLRRDAEQPPFPGMVRRTRLLETWEHPDTTDATVSYPLVCAFPCWASDVRGFGVIGANRYPPVIKSHEFDALDGAR